MAESVLSEVPNSKTTEIKMDNEYFPDARKFTLNQSGVEQRQSLLDSHNNARPSDTMEN